MFVENKVMQHRHAGDDVHLNKWRVDDHISNTIFFPHGILNNVLFIALYILKYICIEIYNEMNIN